MKHNTNRFFSIILAAIMVVCCVVPMASALAVDDTYSTPNYASLFSQALTSDGAESELVASELADAFDSNAENLIDAIAEYTTDEDEIDTITYLLSYGQAYRNFTNFELEIKQLQNSAVDDDAIVLESILNAINLFHYYDSIQLPDDSYIAEGNAFDPDTILNFIQINEESGNVDEEFFHVIGSAYRADPELFASTISQLNNSSVNYIARAVAYDCINHSDYTSTQSLLSIDTSQDTEDNIISIIEAEIANTSNGTLASFVECNQYTFAAQPRSSYVPTIGTMTYSSAPLYVGTSEALSVTFTESAHSSVARTYYTEVYAVRNGTAWLKSSKSITIPSGSTSTTISYPISFSDVGTFYTLVKVYSSNGGTLLTSRQGTYSDTIYGKWSIRISFSSDRSQLGTLTLYNASGTSQMSISCLGKSAYGYDMYTTNGDTPTGTYTGYLYGPVSPESSYGPYKVVAMDGVSGVIISSGRSGIWIHGGDAASAGTSTYPLRPTYGCVRISNSNQNTLQTTITSLTSSTGYHDATGNITISQS